MTKVNSFPLDPTQCFNSFPYYLHFVAFCITVMEEPINIKQQDNSIMTYIMLCLYKVSS